MVNLIKTKDFLIHLQAKAFLIVFPCTFGLGEKNNNNLFLEYIIPTLNNTASFYLFILLLVSQISRIWQLQLSIIWWIKPGEYTLRNSLRQAFCFNFLRI